MHSYTIHTHTDTLSHTFTHTLHVHSRITALLIWAINVQRESIKTKSNDQFDRTISYALKLPLPPHLSPLTAAWPLHAGVSGCVSARNKARDRSANYAKLPTPLWPFH